MTGRDFSRGGFQEDPDGPAPMDVESVDRRKTRTRAKESLNNHNHLRKTNSTTSLSSKDIVEHVGACRHTNTDCDSGNEVPRANVTCSPIYLRLR